MSKLDQLKALREARARPSRAGKTVTRNSHLVGRGEGLQPDGPPVGAVAAQPARDTKVKARKKGRPRIGEKRDRPWEALGMSQSTWYRRRKERADA